MKLGTFRSICRLLREGGFPLHSRTAVGILIKKAGHLPVDEQMRSVDFGGILHRYTYHVEMLGGFV